jgi:carboxymethylenebutenolidase
MVIVQHPSQPNPNEPRNFERTVTFGKRRDAGTGFMAYSERIGPGVLVLHEAYGLSDSFKQLAIDLRNEGFTVLAPDLFNGTVTTELDVARTLASAMDRERTLLKLRAAAAFLVDNWHPRVGVLGFSMGAGQAADLAQSYPVEATVLYYGAADLPIGRWNGPVLAHYAQEDDLLPLEVTRAFTGALEDGGVDLDAYLYPAGHSFANREIPGAFQEELAAEAWERTVDFLRYHLA